MNRQPTLQQQALRWISRLQGEPDNHQLRHDFEHWLQQSPQHAETFRQCYRQWQALASVPQLQQALAHEDLPCSGWISGNHQWLVLLASAAMVLLAILLWPQTQLQQASRIHHYQTASNEHQSLTLEDGSKIHLSGDTQLWVNLNDQHRQVQLLSGSAYFEVSKDKQRPFIVRQDELTVTVLGTAFEVRTGRSGQRVQVSEGTVQVGYGQTTPAQLIAGQQLSTLPGDRQVTVSTFSSEQTASWRFGRLNYQDTALASIIDDLNRYRENKILLANQAVGEQRLTLSLTTTDGESLLSLLEANQLAQVIRQGDAVLLDVPQPTP